MTHFPMMVDKMCKYQVNPTSIVEVTEHMDKMVDGWMDGQMGRTCETVCYSNIP